MNRFKALSVSLFLIISSISFSQQVTVNADSKPLNEVLTGLAGTYKIQLSFDDQNLSQYKVSVNATFESPEAAIRRLINGLPLELEKTDEVFVIFPKENLLSRNPSV